MKTVPVRLPFPIDGINRARGFEVQPPNTTSSAVNVRADDVLSERIRGGSRPGMSKTFDDPAGSVSAPINLMAVGSVVEGESISRSLIVGAGGSLFASSDGELIPSGGSLVTEADETIVTESGENITVGDATLSLKQLTAWPYGEDVLIADYDDDHASGEGAVTANVLTSGGVGDWSLLGVAADTDVVLLTQRNGSSVEEGTYAITSVSGGNLTVAATLTDGDVTFRVARGPKVFNPSTATLTLLLATEGQAPLGAPIVTVYGGRAVWCSGRLWFMSRIGDYLDYDYGADAEDKGRAVAGTQSEAGILADDIVACVPSGDDYLIFFLTDAIWVMRGDPVYGGQLDSVSRSMGIVGRFAWCYGPRGEVFFLSRQGVYRISGSGSVLEAVSMPSIPAELIDVDAVNNYVSMAYDHRDDGLHVFVTPRNGDAGTDHWYVSFAGERPSVWRMSLPAGKQPSRVAEFAEDGADERDVVMGHLDGYIRHYDKAAADDDGTTIQSYVDIGPFIVDQDSFKDGCLKQMFMLTDAESDDVTVGVYAGEWAQLVAESTLLQPAYTFTVVGASSARSRSHYPRCRGGAFKIRVSSSGIWAMEQIVVVMGIAGRQRQDQ